MIDVRQLEGGRQGDRCEATGGRRAAGRSMRGNWSVMGGESVGVDVCFQWFLASLHAAEQLYTLPVRSTLHTEGSECKVTKKY